MNFFVDVDCLNYALNRVKKEKYSKSNILVLVEDGGEQYLINGYHTLAAAMKFEADISVLDVEHVTINTKLNKKNFINFDDFKHS